MEPALIKSLYASLYIPPPPQSLFHKPLNV